MSPRALWRRGPVSFTVPFPRQGKGCKGIYRSECSDPEGYGSGGLAQVRRHLSNYSSSLASLTWRQVGPSLLGVGWGRWGEKKKG